MKTIALRYSDNYAPEEGTITLHKSVIEKEGFVWYGNFGHKVSEKIIQEQLKNSDPKFILIKSNSNDYYWAHFTAYLSNTPPPQKYIPKYYRNKSDIIKTWFKIIELEKIDQNEIDKCVVISSGDSLIDSCNKCMTSYFKIEYKGECK